MQLPPTPVNEEQRLAALQRYSILYAESNEVFDAVTRLAARACNVPIALIGLIDAQQQWFLSHHGLRMRQIPRQYSFCAHALAGGELFEVADAANDVRFHDNPLVSGEPRIGSYAGAPIITADGYTLGAVAVMHNQPHALDDAQRSALKELAVVVMRLLETRHAELETVRLRRMLDQSSSEVFVTDALTGFITFASQGALRNTGYSLTELKRLTWSQLEHPDSYCVSDLERASLFAGKQPTVSFTATVVRKDGSTYPVHAACHLDDSEANPQVVTVLTDITERARLEAQLRDSDEQLHALANNVPAVIAYIDRNECYGYYNETYRRLFSSIAVGKSIRSTVEEQRYARLAPHLQKALAGEEANFESSIVVDGALRYWDVHYVPHRRADGTVAGVFTLGTDVTVLREMQRQALWDKQRLAVTLESIGDGVITTDIDGRITSINAVAQQLTGWQRSDALQREVSEVFRIIDAHSGQALESPLGIALRHDGVAGLPENTVLLRRDGKHIPIEDTAAPIRDEQGRILGGVLVFHDVSEARAMAAKMSHLAQHDFLTDLPNRVLLRDRIGQAMSHAKRHQRKVALLFVDLDRFKHVNDTLGHAIGDQLLQQVAKRICACVRNADTVCRQGGDEFVVLLSEINGAHDAALVAEKLIAAGAHPYEIESHQLHVSFSIGISLYPDDATDIDALLVNADAAMYHAKSNGRNNYQFFTTTMNASALERVSIERDLVAALRDDQLVLHYQPKFRLSDGAVIGAEALARWQHPRRGLVAPSEFIPVAEESGLIIGLGNWVLREACRQAKLWRDMGLPLTPLAVNISALQVRQARFVSDLARLIEEHGITPNLLELELTESVVMQAAAGAEQLLRALKQLGVRIAIDDFGTGYSSLSYLKRFPIDALKIDRSFVLDIDHDQDDRAIVTAILRMAKSLKKSVIAEGLETPAQLEFLRQLDCDSAQGYLFCKPISAQALTERMLGGPDAKILHQSNFDVAGILNGRSAS